MGIDLATWRARIGLNYCRQSRYACRPLPFQWRAARWGVEEVMNSTPCLLQGCMAVVSLSLILGYTLRGRPIGRCWCGKVCRPKLRGGSVPSAEVRGMAGTGVIEACLVLRVCAVVLALLLMAGDVERNPGPTGKEGNTLSQSSGGLIGTNNTGVHAHSLPVRICACQWPHLRSKCINLMLLLICLICLFLCVLIFVWEAFELYCARLLFWHTHMPDIKIC